MAGKPEDTLTIMVFQRGRARLSRYRLVLERETEVPATPGRLEELLARWSPDLLAVAADEFDRIHQEALAGPRPLPLLPAPTPGRRTRDLPATICLVIPPGANVSDPRFLIERLAKALLVSPTTELLGSWALRREVERRLQLGQKFTFHYVDLDHFKAYNDHYGFERGDRAIRLLADLLSAAVTEVGTETDLAAHIGGDDFAMLTAPDTAQAVAERLIGTFDAAVPSLYDREDAAQGFIVVSDRKGNEVKYPLLTLSIGAAGNTTRPISGYAELATIASDIKSYAKSISGSVYVADRRRAPSGEQG